MQKCWLSFLLLFAVTICNGQYLNVEIDRTTDAHGYAPCEPSIAISPKDPRVMIGGAVLDKIYISLDSGLTWQIRQLQSKHGVFGDPCLISSAKGDFYYLHLSDPAGRGWADPSILDQIVCERSKDNGATWSTGGAMGLNGSKDQDKEWATTNLKGSRVYTTWTQFDAYNSKSPTDSTVILFSCSNRKAKKWREPVRISEKAGDCLDDDGTVEGAVPAVGPNNEIYVTWALGEKLYFDRSFNGGKSWLANDIVAGDIIGGWDQEIPGINRCNGMPVTACDVSGGEHNGTIYVNFTDERNGADNLDVWLIRSTDKGDTWSAPVRVNDDESNRQQFFTWMTIDQTNGHIYCVFYDRRHYDDHRTDVYLATSTDGGQSFTNERISDSPFIPSERVFFGDYTNIAAHDGVVRPIWGRCDDSVMSIWTAIINK